MSGSYASRLSDYKHKGVCGLPERTDKGRTLLNKMSKLTKMVQEAKHLVILTGAGISTSSGIPDFRGPSGIWTMEQSKDSKKRKRVEVDFDAAKPTLTHRAIKKLVDTGKVKFVVTQNVDGLHRRSGLSRDQYAVLHGCVFTEVCEGCRTEHFRDFDVGTISFAKTGRSCDKCGGDLIDTLLDWEDALPEFDLERTQQQCGAADLVIAMGTSLRIEPAGGLPTLAKKFCIMNLQVTPYDSTAALVVRAPVDQIMQELMEGLCLDDWDATGETQAEIQRYWKQPKPVDD